MSETATTRRKARSPRYPGVSLDVAIQRARALYAQEKRHWAPIDSIQEHWGYRPGTGPASVAIAALKQFGLLEDEGANENRKARLTNLALEIILAPETPGRFIRQAALTPEIHKELWELYSGSLPSDATLRRSLIIDRGFTESGAQEFTSQLRKTVAFARLDEIGIADKTSAAPIEDEGLNQSPVAETPDPPRVHQHVQPAPIGHHSFPILLPGGKIVQISGDFPISEAAWRHMMNVLGVFKVALVEGEPISDHHAD